MSRVRPMRGLVPRAAWGAALPIATTPLERAAVAGIAVHYTAAHADEQARHANCAARVLAVQRFHMETRGWFDVAYNFLVCRHGAIFVGRGWFNRSAAQGTNEGNARYVAVAFLGDDFPGRDDVTRRGRLALERVFRRFYVWYGAAPILRPHSYFHPTSCPGDELRRFLSDWRP